MTIFSRRTIGLSLLWVLVWSSVASANEYSFSMARKETPQDFTAFLWACTPLERIQMAQVLRELPNTPSAEKLWKQMETGIRERSAISPEAIRKALVWRAYNKLTYYFRDDEEVDYHGIVQWAAEKAGIPRKQIKESSTFDLEKVVAERYFAKLWDKMTPEQKEALLSNIVNKEEAESEERMWKLGAKRMVSCSLLPIVYILAPNSAVLGLLMASIDYSGSEEDTVSAFIMIVNMIKTRRWANEQ